MPRLLSGEKDRKKLKQETLSSEGMTQNVHDRHMQAKEGGEEK